MLPGVNSKHDSKVLIGMHGFSAEVARAIERGSRRLPPLGITARSSRIEALLGAGAWLEAALGLVQLEAPNWSVRRLVLDDGEWLCSLSRFPAVPDEFDEAAEGRHRLLPLAILGALAEALQSGAVPPAPPPGMAARNAVSDAAAWCDNCR